MLKIGAQDITGLYVGETKIEKAYLGADLVFSAKKPSRLPEGYTEVEYITGGASSNSNYRPYFYIPATSGARRLKFAFSSSTPNLFNQSSPYYVIARNASTSTATNGLVWYGFGCQSNHFHVNYGSRANQIDVENITPQKNVKYDIDINGPAQTCTINGVVTSAYSAIWMASKFGVFYPFDVDTKYYPMYNYAMYPVTIFYLQLLDANDNLLRDLVPCKDSAGVAGFYDVVTNTFFKNENTFNNAQNVFTPGPAV